MKCLQTPNRLQSTIKPSVINKDEPTVVTDIIIVMHVYVHMRSNCKH